MKTGFIGAGKVGCSLGRYFTEKGRGLGLSVEGYFSPQRRIGEGSGTFY